MLRGSLIQLIYRKTMTLTPSAVEERTPLTIMSADIERISTGLNSLHDSWACVLQIPLALYLLWREIGVASIASFIVAICEYYLLANVQAGILIIFIVCILGAGFISTFAGDRQAVWLDAIQSRVDATAQMLGTIKGIKMTGFTGKIATIIQRQREEEISKSEKFRKLLIAMVGIGELQIS